MDLARFICTIVFSTAFGLIAVPAAAQWPLPLADPSPRAEQSLCAERLPAIGEEMRSVAPVSFLAPKRDLPPEPELIPSGALPAITLPPTVPASPYWTHYGGKARAYYINDQRFEFTGAEATFAVEGVLEGGIHQNVRGWDVMVESQFFLNQPFDRNILVDTPLRRSFAHNFDVDPFQISQLYLAARKEDFFLQAGKFVTPFGRFYYPMYLNNFSDSPFIRSEAILYRETGILAQWDPDGFVFTAALTNGGINQDTNSSKALIARVGIDRPWFACGASIKWQDGVGSEGQKQYNNHIGMDAMISWNNWRLSGEVIYDEYGFRRPGFDQNDITWGRSIYFRDLNNALNVPLTGVGYYVNLGYEGPLWTIMLNYGDFFPNQKLGVAAHDTPNHRGLLKASYHFTQTLEAYGVALIENTVPLTLNGTIRFGNEIIAGVQFSM